MSGRLFRVEHVESDDKGSLQTTTLLGPMGETLKKVHRIQPFGFASNVPKGSHGLGVQFGGGPDGGRTLTAVLGLEHQDYRPKQTEVGSSRLYDMNGNLLDLTKAAGKLKHSKQAEVEAPVVVITGTDKTTILAGGMKIIVTPGRIDLGGEGGSPVMTQAGPSSKVFAIR